MVNPQTLEKQRSMKRGQSIVLRSAVYETGGYWFEPSRVYLL